MSSRPTIRDVAEAAGVSVSTVSRVLSRPEMFRESTRQRVQAAALLAGLSDGGAAEEVDTARRVGDLLLSVADFTRRLGVDPEDALRQAARRLREQVRQAERS